MHPIRYVTAVSGLTFAVALSWHPAAAQGLFETLFGARPARAALPQGYADPGRDQADPGFQRRPARVSAESGSAGSATATSGPATAYCVRLCDGRYFPLERHAQASPVELCSTFCPASRTKVYFGSDIDGARAHDGSRYSALDHAFLYRKQVVPDCTCNGTTHYGLAPVDPARDPTLRPGDLVAGNKGLMAFRGMRGRGGSETAAFTPVRALARDTGIAVAGKN